MKYIILAITLAITTFSCDDDSSSNNANNTNNTNTNNTNNINNSNNSNNSNNTNTNNNNNTTVPDYPDCTDALFFVSPDGSDENDGSEGAPFATFTKAAQAVSDEIGSYETHPGGFTVCIEDGAYKPDAAITLNASHSGLEGAPMKWVARNKNGVFITGSTAVASEHVRLIESSDADYNLFAANVRDRIYTFDAGDAGITDLGTLESRGYRHRSNPSALELFVGKKRMHLARWPDEKVYDTVAPNYPATVSGDVFGTATTFTYMGTTATGNADDGYPNYQANVSGTDYYLYHCTWEWGGATHRYWFVSTADPTVSANCWPTGITAWGGSGTDNIPVLGAMGGSATDDIIASNRPVDYAYYGYLRVPEVLSDASFVFPGDRHLNWTSDNIFVHGLFGNYWADDTIPVEVTGNTVNLLDTLSYGLDPQQPFYFLNVPEELDSEGEYWVNHDTGRVYFYSETLPSVTIEVSETTGPLMEVSSGSHAEFWGIVFEGTRGNLVSVSGSDSVSFNHCTFRNSGLRGLSIEGFRSGVSHCNFSSTGDTALSLNCGLRSTLTDGECFARDSEFTDFGFWNRTYATAVTMAGCGNIVEHNYMHHAPHSAILYSGNNHRIAFNDIGHVVSTSGDAGAIYIGRDWGYRGNLIEQNYIHHVNSVFGASNGVYLDDAASGITVRNNIIHSIYGCAIQSGGGRDNIMEFNIITEAHNALCTDRRARAVANNNSGDSWNLLERINAVFESYHHNDPIDHQSEPWSTAYPALAAIPDSWAQIQDSTWLDPEGCVFARNIVFNCEGILVEGTWGGAGAIAIFADTTENVEEDPLYTDPDNGDMSLPQNSPAWSLTGFTGIDFESIGIR
ncbi:right-handed parallel beta-helix repeat-containing protein [Myxococcota bacterium]|nr:right-handed parallel beta-helix repeat-containing protein [Myxococcota bacterium]MBU1380479.1 right-handed parallel beta-helix repeat-containing protein [Myxococcota bacterium]MBU1496819.1 right-handed parallel beta-helix repeat-containing protein [Myxococcota bacterium]